MTEKVSTIAALPSVLEAEQALLGAMLLDPEAIDSAQQQVRPDWFYSQSHATIYSVICELHNRQLPVDVTSVVSELKRRKLLEKIGGPGYIASLPSQVFSVASVEHYVRLMRDAYERRELLRICDSIKLAVLEDGRDVSKIIEETEKAVFDLSLERKSTDFVPMAKVVPELLQELELRRREEHRGRGVETGFPDLDDLTGGLQPSDLIILAARPSVGKTALAMNIALNVGTGRLSGFRVDAQLRRPVGIFSLEMSAQQIAQRLLASLARVSISRIREGNISAKHEKELERAAAILAESPIHIDDTPNITVLELRSKARRLKSRVPDLALIVVDYLQLMHSGGRAENRQQEVAEITRSLKALARELNLPVLALSQLSRQVEQRKGKKAKPQLSDLRESGAIEQDADIVMFIHRDTTPERNADAGGADTTRAKPSELIIGKHRNGPTDVIPLIFFDDIATFYPYRTERHDERDEPGY